MSGSEAMWRIRKDLDPRVLDELSRPLGMAHRNDLIVARVHDQGRDIELLEVLSEVSLRERLDALIRVLQTGLHAQGPEVIEDSLRDLGTVAVGAEKGHGKIPPELRTVLREPGAQV